MGDAYLALTVTCCGDEKESPVKRSVFLIFLGGFKWAKNTFYADLCYSDFFPQRTVHRKRLKPLKLWQV